MTGGSQTALERANTGELKKIKNPRSLFLHSMETWLISTRRTVALDNFRTLDERPVFLSKLLLRINDVLHTEHYVQMTR